MRLDLRVGGHPTVVSDPSTGCRSAPHVRAPAQWTRRHFLQLAAGVTAVGAAAGTQVMRAAGAGAAGPSIDLVEPIPTTVEFFPGVESHLLAPPFLFGPDSDPSTVFNFRGSSAIAFLDGEVERRNRRTGETRVLPFVATDMRFMQGIFRGTDGRVRDATFAFI
jgi:hypothetical protein